MRRFVTISTCVLVLVVFGAVATQVRADFVPAAATCGFQVGNDPNSGSGVSDNVGLWATYEQNGTAYRFDMSAYSGMVAQGDGTFTINLQTGNPYSTHGHDPSGVKIQLYTMDPADSDWEEMQATYNVKKTGVAWSYGTGKAFDYILSPSTLVGELTYNSTTHGEGPLNITVSKAAIDQGIAAGAINWMAKTDNWDSGIAYYGFRVCSNQWAEESLRPTLSFTPVPEPSALCLLSSVLLGLLAYAWRKRR